MVRKYHLDIFDVRQIQNYIQLMHPEVKTNNVIVLRMPHLLQMTCIRHPKLPLDVTWFIVVRKYHLDIFDVRQIQNYVQFMHSEAKTNNVIVLSMFHLVQMDVFDIQSCL